MNWIMPEPGTRRGFRAATERRWGRCPQAPLSELRDITHLRDVQNNTYFEMICRVGHRRKVVMQMSYGFSRSCPTRLIKFMSINKNFVLRSDSRA